VNRFPEDQSALKILASRDFNQHWKLRAAYKSENHNNHSPNNQYYSGDASANGDLQRFGLTSPRFKQWTHELVTDLLGKFEALGVKNSVLFGFDDYYQAGHYTANFDSPPSINIYNPIYNQPYTPPDSANEVYVSNGQHAYGLYVQDQVTLPAHLFLLAGFRFDRVTTYNTGYSQSSAVYDQPSPTPRFGILWQPLQQVSLYASYAGNYGATPLGYLTSDGKTLPPESDQQYEFGVKTEWFNKRLSATTSVYRITKRNVPAADPSNPAFTIAIGEALSKGVELDVSGQITSNWRIIGGYSYIGSYVTADNNTPSLAGLRFPGIPYNSGSLWTVYEFPGPRFKGLKFGGGVLSRSGELAWESPTGTSYIADRIAGFAIANAMAGYTWHFEKFRLVGQLNIDNLLDKTYFGNVNPSRALPGAPITLIPSLRVEF
jgi:iron complex outermembrane recepter protein